MKIIFNADDFGLSKGVNFGIIDAYENGLVRSATIMANMPGFDHGVSLWKSSPGLKIGVHLVLTSGVSLGDSYKTITDGGSNFLNQATIFQRAKDSELDLSEIEKEFTLQIDKILAAGIPITHFDGHHHVQTLPGVADIVTRLAERHGVAVRAFGNSPTFDGTFYGEAATISQLEHILSTCTENMEIMCHPAYLDSFLYNNSSYNIHRMKELDVLVDPRAKVLVEKYGHTLSSFADL